MFVAAGAANDSMWACENMTRASWIISDLGSARGTARYRWLAQCWLAGAPRERFRFSSQEIGSHRRRPRSESEHALPRGFGEAMLGFMPMIMIGPQNKIIDRHPGRGRGQQIIQ